MPVPFTKCLRLLCCEKILQSRCGEEGGLLTHPCCGPLAPRGRSGRPAAASTQLPPPMHPPASAVGLCLSYFFLGRCSLSHQADSAVICQPLLQRFFLARCFPLLSKTYGLLPVEYLKLNPSNNPAKCWLGPDLVKKILLQKRVDEVKAKEFSSFQLLAVMN